MAQSQILNLQLITWRKNKAELLPVDYWYLNLFKEQENHMHLRLYRK